MTRRKAFAVCYAGLLVAFLAANLAGLILPPTGGRSFITVGLPYPFTSWHGDVVMSLFYLHWGSLALDAVVALAVSAAAAWEGSYWLGRPDRLDTFLRRPWRFAAGCGAALLLTSSFLPIWISWGFSWWEAVGYSESLWVSVARIIRGSDHIGRWDSLWRWHGANWLQAIPIFGVGFAAGWLLHRLVRPRSPIAMRW
jgi:hypothetical protein